VAVAPTLLAKSHVSLSVLAMRANVGPNSDGLPYGCCMTAVELATLEDEIAGVTLNRPRRLNAIDGSLMDAMDDVMDVLSTGEFRAAILTGAGRGFCAGADLSGTGEPWTKPPKTAPHSPPFKVSYDAQVRLADLYTRLYELPIPVIAAVNGAAVGGGLAFALHCDIRIASDQARFGSVFIKAGFSSMDMGTSYLLPKIVGAGVARELMLTGRIIDADEAYRIRLVHEVVAPDELMAAALKMARSIVENNAYGVWQTKIGLNTALDAPSLRHAKEIENRTQILTGFTNNPLEAAKALMEKRSPVWDSL
jgi:enoyl-CoA hydratase/carnithine racemase